MNFEKLVCSFMKDHIYGDIQVSNINSTFTVPGHQLHKCTAKWVMCILIGHISLCFCVYYFCTEFCFYWLYVANSWQHFFTFICVICCSSN